MRDPFTLSELPRSGRMDVWNNTTRSPRLYGSETGSRPEDYWITPAVYDPAELGDTEADVREVLSHILRLQFTHHGYTRRALAGDLVVFPESRLALIVLCGRFKPGYENKSVIHLDHKFACRVWRFHDDQNFNPSTDPLRNH